MAGIFQTQAYMVEHRPHTPCQEYAPLTSAVDEGLVLCGGEERHRELSEVCLQHTGHCSNVNLALAVGERVTPCERKME